MSFLDAPRTKIVKERIKQAICKENAPFRDAVEIVSMYAGGDHPRLAAMAINKYLEAENRISPLGKEKSDIDAKAFASMGKLWEGETFSDPKALRDDRDVWVQTLYLFLRYGEDSFKKLLKRNASLPGDAQKRARLIRELSCE